MPKGEADDRISVARSTAIAPTAFGKLDEVIKARGHPGDGIFMLLPSKIAIHQNTKLAPLPAETRAAFKKLDRFIKPERQPDP